MNSNTNIDSELNEKLKQLSNSLRTGQKRLADWQTGRMAISAVPGSGKSHSLAVAAAITIARHQLHLGKQLIIVTYTRSAAASIKQKIRDHLKILGLPQGGFVVYTLHSLALNIANRYPDLSGLNSNDSPLIIPNSSHPVIKSTVEKWLQQNQQKYQILLEGKGFDGEEAERLRRQSVLNTEILPSLANTVIHEAKSSGLTVEMMKELSQSSTDEYLILEIAAGLYEQYELIMRSHNYIDYDDMILAALRVLEHDNIRQKWQEQIFAVFEDEAQDSSPLQEKLIVLLAKDPINTDVAPNLVRVGDPNQAINSTFTPANPIYFNWFCQTCEAEGKLATIAKAGRSSEIIIKAANYLLRWGNNYLVEDDVDKSNLPPFRPQDIQPVDRDDPQTNANPSPEGKGLEIYTPSDIFQSVDLIGKRVIKLLTTNPKSNAAILVRENRQGNFLASQLGYLKKAHDINVYEVSEFDGNSQIPLEILKLLTFLDRPHSPDNLKAALEVLESRNLIVAQDLNALVTYPEQFLYPTLLDANEKSKIKEARRYCCNLLQAKIELPHYQLIPFLGMTLKYTGSELATVEKLSERINQETYRKSSLKNTIKAIEEIIFSEKFESVESDSDNRYTREKQLTIITMHKAKGLDWDYVFIPFLHHDVLPGKLRVTTSAQFLGDFSLAEVARAQIRTLIHSQHQNIPLPILLPLVAWEEAKKLKEAEEFRLLYVAMTRAKRLLWMSAEKEGPFSWNTFKSDRGSNLQSKTACPFLPALRARFPESVQQ